MRQVLLKFAEERLTKKQKLILKAVLSQHSTSSALAKRLSRDFSCSRSCIFSAVNQLKRCGLIDGENGSPLRLTEAGRTVSECIGGAP